MATPGTNDSSECIEKKAAHVKWAGKTIALGTFPLDEAEKKQAMAKALTKAWRSTMRPKPSREWVMLELERHNVRVICGPKAGKEKKALAPIKGATKTTSDKDNDSTGRRLSGTQSGRDALGLEFLADAAQSDSLGHGAGERGMMQMRRNSSLGLLSLLSADFSNEASGLGGVSSPNSEPKIPPHRPLVGSGAAAAYEAARADHYSKLSEQQGDSADKSMMGDFYSGAAGLGAVQQRRLSDLRASLGGLGQNNIDSSALGRGAPDLSVLQQRGLSGLRASLGGGGFPSASAPGPASLLASGGQMGTATGSMDALGQANPAQHYEMLKMHHMNLLEEIQETTFLMNLYQQKQKQKHQQHPGNGNGNGNGSDGSKLDLGTGFDINVSGFESGAGVDGGLPLMQSLLGQQGFLGGGGVGMGDISAGVGGMMNQRRLSMQQSLQSGMAGATEEGEDEVLKIKEEIAAREKSIRDLESALMRNKRMADDAGHFISKRVKHAVS